MLTIPHHFSTQQHQTSWSVRHKCIAHRMILVAEHVKGYYLVYTDFPHLSIMKDSSIANPPPVITLPAPLFLKVYMDTMHMPTLSGYQYIVQGCYSLIYWPEWAMLHKENAKALRNWILQDIIYCWGLLLKIVTNNGPAFLKALAYLEKHYHIKHIRILGYNSHANGLVEQLHFEVREAIFKACDGEESKWSGVAYSIFWAERVTIRHRMGCSPYFAATGTHSLLPIDIAEANYLLPPPNSILSSTNLISQCAITISLHNSRKRSMRQESVLQWLLKNNMNAPSMTSTSNLAIWS